jgi:hypothetical protein
MSLNNNNSGIRLNVHDNDVIENTSFFIINQNTPIQNNINSYSQYVLTHNFVSASMIDIMYEFFDDIIDYDRMEDRMMDIAMTESFNNYKTQEKKPGVKICIESICVDDKHKGEPCAVCKSEFEINEKITVLNCNHIYHTDCIGEWVKYKSECPVCRAEIPTNFTQQ